METFNIKGVVLEYDDETHTYVADGVIVPSITTVLSSTKFKGMYADIDKEVLKRAADRGTRIHKDIEDFCKGIEHESDEVRGFKFLQKQYDIVPLLNEIPVLIFYDGKPIMAGRFDLLADIEGKLTLADIKSTSTLNIDYLGYQLNLYRVGLWQSYDQDVERLAGIHLRGMTRKLTDIAIDDFKVAETLERMKGVKNE